MASEFYDKLTPFYHLIYADWESSIGQQARDLESIIREYWGEKINTVLDASCGIGTQSLGLSQLGFKVTASDLSFQTIKRGKEEALNRGLNIEFSLADMREIFEHYCRTFDMVMACDNSIPHLLTDAEIYKAFEQFYQSTKEGGGCIISVRDYAAEEETGVQVKPYGIRYENGIRYLIFQVWEFEGKTYELDMYFIEDSGGANCKTQVMRSKYYAVTIEKLVELMSEAGYKEVQRVDGRYFQPVIIGTKPSAA